MPQVSIEPLFSQHRDERSQQRDQETCIHQPGDGNDLAGRDILDGWNGGGFARDGGLIEGEKD